MRRKGSRWLLGGLTVTIAILALVSLAIGPAPLAPQDVWRAVVGGEKEVAALIVLEVRLPRTILALMTGATLGLAGAALQGFLRNPLAEPGLIGVSASAAFGAVLTFYTGMAAWFSLALPLGGMAGAVAGVLLVQALAGRGGSALTLILAGIAVSAFAGALTSLVLNFAPNPFAALEIVFWLMGSLADRSMEHVWLAGPFMLAGWIVVLSSGRPLAALTLGEEATASLGFNLGQVRTSLVLGTALSVGAATAVAGAIGFVGLVVPHLLRPLVGERPSALLPASALGGGAMLLLADIAVRAFSPAQELKLGVLTALVGAPFFLFLIVRLRRELL